jgi:hypothetical protein
MKKMHFIFFKLLPGVEITTSLRVSLWLDEGEKYLLPCQFIEVWEESNFYTVKIEVLDSDNFIKDKFIEHKFLFGHPGKIIGYGFLKEIG